MAKKLTEPTLKSMKPGEQRREIPDGLRPGLYHVIQPSGARSWAVRYRAGGKPRKLTLGKYPAMDLAKAREAAANALVAAQNGADPAAEKQDARRAAKAENQAGLHRFENVARTFLARHAKPNNRSWKETARQLGLVPDKTLEEGNDDPMTFWASKGSVVARWRARHIGEIRRTEIIELLDEIVDRGAPIAANRMLAALRKLFNWASERGLIEVSPCATVKAPSKETSRDRVLTDDELCWLWKATDVVGYPFGPVVRLLVLTGQRRDEVAGMVRSEIGGAIWTIPKERAKNDKAHAVPFSAPTREIIASLPKIVGRKGYLFSTTGTSPVSGWSRAKTALDRQMLAIARREAAERGADPDAVTIPNWTFHDLRRTASSGMAGLGIAVHVVERLLNHLSGSIRGVAAVYNRHDYWKERTVAAEAWGRYVTDLAGGRSQVNVVTMRSENR